MVRLHVLWRSWAKPSGKIRYTDTKLKYARAAVLFLAGRFQRPDLPQGAPLASPKLDLIQVTNQGGQRTTLRGSGGV